MSLINVADLTFSYDGGFETIFENISFQIDTDWKLGLIGRNGRGKTTFLNLLMGKYTYSGTISACVQFEYFPFDVPDNTLDTLEVAEDIADFKLWEIKRELSMMEVPEDVLYRPFRSLSNGEQTKVLLCSLFLRENSFLLIDEPTSHLDLRARKLVSRYLGGKKGFILVSHDRTVLDSCVDHILSINRANIEIQQGNFTSWFRSKELQDRYELDENEKLKKEIRRLQTAARRTSDWSEQMEKTKYNTLNSGIKPDRGYIGHQSAKMMKRSKTIEARRTAAAEEKSKLLKNIEPADDLRLSPLQYHGETLLDLDDVSISFGDRRVCEHVRFTLCRNDRIALYGKNGSGKSSLLKLVCGQDIPYEGRLYRAGGLVISYVPQDASSLSGSLFRFAEEHGLDQALLLAILRKLDFSRTQFETDLRSFSAGQKKKVLIAKSLCEKAHLYVWDEPLNYIDVFSRMQIEELLLSSQSTVLFVEHDSTFVDTVATKKICL